MIIEKEKFICFEDSDIDKSGTLTVPEGVKTIESRFFFGLSKKIVKRIILPDSVKAIEDSAFMGLDKLEDIELPKNLEKIGNWAFEDCSIRSIIIPESVTSIGIDPFCETLEQIVVEPGNKMYESREGVLISKKDKILITYPQAKKDKVYVIPKDIEVINDSAFIGAMFSKLEIHEGVKKIGKRAFVRCNGLETIIVDSNNAFYESKEGVLISKEDKMLIKYPSKKKGLKYVIPDDIEAIGYNAFDSSELSELEIPESTKKIYCSFLNCENLKIINVKEGNSYYESGDGVLFSKAGELIAYPRKKNDIKYEIPNKIKSINSNAFNGAELLSEIIIPSSVMYINGVSDFAMGCGHLTEITVDDKNMFYNSKDGVLFSNNGELLKYPYGKNVSEYRIPDNTNVIGSRAFSYSKFLKSLQIPDSVIEIGNDAVNYCDSLTNISVSENNPVFRSYEGVLYDKQMTELLIYPEGKKEDIYILPESVKKIPFLSLGDNNLTQVLSVFINLTSIKEYPMLKESLCNKFKETPYFVFDKQKIESILKNDKVRFMQLTSLLDRIKIDYQRRAVERKKGPNISLDDRINDEFKNHSNYIVLENIDLYNSLHDNILCIYKVAESTSCCCIHIELYYTRSSPVC